MATKADAEYKSAHVKERIKQIEGLDGEKDSAHGSYMNRCAKINERRNAAIDAASRQGIPAKALRTLVKIRKARAKAQAILAKLDEDERKAVEALAVANNDAQDLPLFRNLTNTVTALAAE